MEEYDEQLVRWLIVKVIVHDNRFGIEFKLGIEIQIDDK